MKFLSAAMVLVPMLGGCKGMAWSNDDAPFRLGRLVGQVWALDPDNDELDKSAVLVLSNSELPCEDLTQNAYNELDAAVGDGQGILFMLQQDIWNRDETPGTLTWEGLWVSGYAYSSEGGEREMQSVSFSDGFVYYDFASYYGLSGGVWLQVDEAGSGGVSGSFSTSYWHGSFSAEDCGPWEEPTDTWDSWWGDDSF